MVSVKRTLRKGRGGWEFGETKCAGSRRAIRLQNWVLQRLKELSKPALHAFEDVDECSEAKELIFLSEFGRAVDLNSLVYKHFKPS